MTEGRIKILTSVSVIEEGFDLPSAEAAILLRPTTSLGLHLQQIGRVLRPATDKKAVILDHVGNLLTHGLAEDTREWSLDGIEKKKKGQKNEPATHVQCKRSPGLSKTTVSQIKTGKIALSGLNSKFILEFN